MAGIAAVERDTGISKETLRIWERRYGFPRPKRGCDGIRSYSDEDIAKLFLTKRLLDRGMRAGEIVPKSIEELQALDRPDAPFATRGSGLSSETRPSFRVKDIDRFRLWLRERANSLSAEDFILDVVCPLCTEIGIAWQTNEIGIFEEHLLSEQISEILRELIARFTEADSSPRILLTTLPGERHGFGILMLQTLLVARSFYCLSLGVETPVGEIIKCVESAQIDFVALSFSSHFPAHRLRSDLKEIRQFLPPTVNIIAGGSAIGRIKTKLSGIILLPELSDALAYLDGAKTVCAAS